MLAKKILKNLENGNYCIEYKEHCDCGFYWIEREDRLDCVTVYNDSCYYRNELIMDNLAREFDDETIVGSDGVIATYDTLMVLVCSFSVRMKK